METQAFIPIANVSKSMQGFSRSDLLWPSCNYGLYCVQLRGGNYGVCNLGDVHHGETGECEDRDVSELFGLWILLTIRELY